MRGLRSRSESIASGTKVEELAGTGQHDAQGG